MAALSANLKIRFFILFNQKANNIDSKLGQLVHQNKLNFFRSEIQKNLFGSSSPEPNLKMTPNLVGNIEAPCRSKLVKIISDGIFD